MMLISLAFIFLLTPTPSLQASIGERKNSTKPTPHAINLSVLPKPVTSALNLKPKTQSSPAAASKASEVSQSPSAKPAGSNEAQKASKDKPPSSSTITVIISEGCVQKEPQKDAANATKVQQVELNIKPGSPLVMKHHINVDISTCTGTCEAEMEALKGRVELLEREMTAMKKKCAPCSEEQCPNNCSGQGRCERGQCRCQLGFSGPDCSKGADKKSKLTVETVAMRVSESDAVKQDTSAGKKTKVDKMILEKKVDDEKEPKKEKKAEPTAKPSTAKPATATSKDQDNETRDRNEAQVLLRDGKRLEQATRGKATVIKMESDKQSQSDLTIKASTKQESAEKLSTKQEKLKDVPVNQNVTQSAEKKLNGASKVLSSLAKGAKASANVTVKASSGKGKLPQPNMISTENDKKVVTGGASGRQTVEKHSNGTVSIEKDKVQLQGNATLPKDGGKKKVDKHVNVTTSVEKDKTELQGNDMFLKEGSSGKKKADSHLNVTSSEKDKKLLHSDVTTAPKSGKKKPESHVNVTAPSTKDKRLTHGNETATLKEGTSGKKKVEKHVDVSSSIEKDKTQRPGNATLPKDGSSGKKKVEKHVDVSSSIEKDKTQLPGNATLPKDGSSGKKKVEKHVDVSSSIEKDKTQLPGNATLPKDGLSGKKKVEKHVDVSSSIEKDKTQLPGNATLPKDGSSGKKKVEKHVDVSSSIEKDKTQLPGNATLPKDGSSGKKKVEKHVDVSSSIEKDKTQLPGNATLPKDGLSGKKKVEKHVDVSSSIEKDKTQLPGNATLPKDGSSGKKKVEKHVDVSSSIEKDKTQLPGNATLPKDGLSGKKKVEKHVDVSSSIEKDKTQLPGNATLPKDGSSGKKKVEKHVDVSSSIEKDKTQLPGNATLPKDGSSGKKKVEKHVDVSSSIEKDKTQLPGNATLPKDGSSGKKKVENYVDVSSSIEKDKTQLLGNATLPKEGKKKVEKQVHVATSIEKDKKLHQVSATLLKEDTSVKKKVEKHGNITTSTEKDKKLQQANEIPVLKEAKKKVEKHANVMTSIEKDKTQLQANATLPKEGRKKVEKQVNVGSSIEKDKKAHQVDATLLKEEASGKRKVEKHVNVMASIEKDRTQSQSNATLPKEGLSGKKKVGKQIDVVSSIEKDKEPQQVNATVLREEAFGKKTVEKHVNITTTVEKDKTQLQGSTLPKVAKKKVEKHVNVTSSIEDKKQHQASEEASGKKRVSTTIVFDDKDKKQLQGSVTAGLGERAARKEKLESHGNTTVSHSKGKMLRQSSETTALKDVGDKKKKAASGVDIMVSTEKEKLSHVNETAPLKGVTSGRRKVEKHVNVTVSTGNVSQVNATLLKEASGKKKADATITLPSEKDKKQLQVEVMTSLRESMKTKVEGGVGFANAEAKTTKLDVGSVEVHNITATGFVITWEARQGAFRNFTVTRREVPASGKDEDDAQEAEDKGSVAGNEAEIHGSNRTSKAHSGKADRKSAKKFSQVLSGTARSFHFRNLQPQMRYLVSLYSSRPGGASKLQRLFVSTGPEPPTDLMFSNITEMSLSVSWTKPKSIVTGFRVTYTNTANGETGSMSVDSQLSHVLISKLSTGSSYEISVRSLLETMESEPITASVITVPDPPADLQAVNITDSKALLIWKPAGAKVDHYILSYGSAKSPNVTVTVMLSGSSVEHQLRGLHRFTLYTVKIISQINNLQSRSIYTTFSTTSGVKLQAVTPSEVTFSSAVISWKSPRLAFRSYRLTYQHGEDVKEVILNPTVTRYELTDLVAFSNYTVRVDGESEGQYVSVVSTAFTTAQVPYPFPTDCSQVQLNGVKESGEAEVYPEGKDGEPVWVYCDMDTEGGGWTVFQRRVDGSTDFFRGWKDYSKGFGLLTTEFWLGNDVLHTLTSLTPMSLRIDLRYGNDTAFAHYSNFTVGSEANHYAITLSGYSGTAGDSMRYHNGRPFSTKDKDPNPLSIHCAKAYRGGWWYKNCYKANLNGLYATFSENQGVVWIDWKGKDVSIPFTEMKLRPASLNL